jgi:hypothetical protein
MSSHMLQAIKPDEACFRKALDACGVTPEVPGPFDFHEYRVMEEFCWTLHESECWTPSGGEGHFDASRS